MDALSRGVIATEHAANISRSAAKAFEDQAATLQACKRTIEGIAMHPSQLSRRGLADFGVPLWLQGLIVPHRDTAERNGKLDDRSVESRCALVGEP